MSAQKSPATPNAAASAHADKKLRAPAATIGAAKPNSLRRKSSHIPVRNQPSSSDKTTSHSLELPKIENKALVRLQASSLERTKHSSADDDSNDDVTTRENSSERGLRVLTAKKLHKRRKKRTFLTAVDSSSSTGDLHADDVATASSSVTGTNRDTALTPATPGGGTKSATVGSKSGEPSSPEVTSKPTDNHETTIKVLRRDKSNMHRKNVLLSERLEHLSERIEKLSQDIAQPKRVVRTKTAAIQVSPILEEAATADDASNAVPDDRRAVKMKQLSDDNELCLKLIDDLLSNVKQRQQVLKNDVDPPPRGTNVTRMREHDKNTPTPKSVVVVGARTENDDDVTLRDKVQQLAQELNLYTYQEKEITHRYKLRKHETSTGALSHRSHDEIEGQLHVVERSLVRYRGQGQSDEITQFLEHTKHERDTCYHMMCTIERQIRKRRLKLQMSTASKSTTAVAARGATGSQYPKQYMKTNLSKKLVDIRNEIKQYIDVEQSVTRQVRRDYERKSKYKDDALKQQNREIQTLKHRLEFMTQERDRLKDISRDYAHAQSQETADDTVGGHFATKRPNTSLSGVTNVSDVAPQARQHQLTSLKQLIKKRQQQLQTTNGHESA